MAQWLQVVKTTTPVVDFLEWQRQGSLDLNPVYQRRSVWTTRQKSLLIDSLLRGYPVPLIFLHHRLDVRTSTTVRQVVDGQQRLRTILAFLDPGCIDEFDEERDRFSVLKSHNPEFAGMSFEDLPQIARTRLLETPLSINILPSDIKDVTVLEIFQRMNSTGLKLTPQEIRNARFYGEFKSSAYKLAYQQNQRWQAWGIFSSQQIAQMKEVEFTADLMGFLLHGIRARSEASITALFNEFEDSFPDQGVVEQRFRSIFDFLETVYGSPEYSHFSKRFRSQAWFYSVFALAHQSDLQSPHALAHALDVADSKLRDEDNLHPDLHKVLRGATADRTSREARIRFLSEQMS